MIWHSLSSARAPWKPISANVCGPGLGFGFGASLAPVSTAPLAFRAPGTVPGSVSWKRAAPGLYCGWAPGVPGIPGVPGMAKGVPGALALYGCGLLACELGGEFTGRGVGMEGCGLAG